MTKVDKLFVVAADQLKGTVADTMRSLGANESSIASVHSFSNAIPFRWEETRSYCKKLCRVRLGIDWYERHDKKRKPKPEGKEGDSEASVDVPDTPPLSPLPGPTSNPCVSVALCSWARSVICSVPILLAARSPLGQKALPKPSLLLCTCILNVACTSLLLTSHYCDQTSQIWARFPPTRSKSPMVLISIPPILEVFAWRSPMSDSFHTSTTNLMSSISGY